MLRPKRCAWLLLSLLLVGGCATQPLTKTINLPTADPQTAGQLAGVQKIAVMDITCPAPQVGEVMATTLSAQLAAAGRYQVADRPTILQTGFSATQVAQNGVSADMAAQLGAKIGADAVLVGEASFAQANNGLNEGSQPKAIMTVNYRLIDVKTKNVLLSERETCAVETTSSKTLNRHQATPTPEELRQSLAEQFAVKVTARLSAPGQRPVPRDFAVDPLGLAKDTLISRGNRYAECGTFDEAAKLYMQAVQEDAQCHQALYNLGLLAESTDNRAAANQYFQSAMHLNDCRLYIQAYQRTRSS